MYVLNVVLVQTFVRLKQFIRLNNTSYKKSIGCFLRKAAFFIALHFLVFSTTDYTHEHRLFIFN
ncbi:hypothetical protein ADH74_08890 [Bacteroides caecimuris]|uniref:Uncharacterized protein n=1 Tax=Bacteroides caecimuris TaxID=1796613 RepID=A0A1V0QDA0_9BACE|nr:hypothetical protein A4V03_20635 [Bacteroides caecimuris]OXE65914.1 hypothetical protein ADH74_08890 [Bacteroides caecimuris]